MGPPGKYQNASNSGNGWPSQPHQIPSQVSHYHQAQHPQVQRMRTPMAAMPGTSNSHIPNNVQTIQYAKTGYASRGSTMPGSTVTTTSTTKRLKNRSMFDKEKSQTWHDYPLEKKQLKKHKFSADVFPQDSNQEEDKLTPERIKKGYQIANRILTDESETMKKLYSDDNFDGDNLLVKAALFIQTVNVKKPELLDKRKLSSISFVPYKDAQKRAAWFNDLSKSKPYASLAKRIPILRGEDCLEAIFEYKVPVHHAVWLLKINHVGYEQQQRQEKQATSKVKKTLDSYDYTSAFIKLIRDLLDKMEDEATVAVAKQKWKYYSVLIRHAVLEGLVIRQEFFFELADILAEIHQKCSLEKMQLYRILIPFISLFTREITSNVFIARKFLYYVSLRLRGYVEEYERRRKTRLPAKQVLTELLSCNNHRMIILTSFGVISSIIIDCPEACIWMPLDEATAPPYCIGSPLDVLPIDPLLFPTFLNEKETFEFIKSFKLLLAAKLKSIHERSCEIDNRWALNSLTETNFHQITRTAVDVVGLLDTADIFKPRGLYELYAKVFGFTKGCDSYDGELTIRVKAMFNWAITHEREGSYRALLVANLLLIYNRHFRSLFLESKTLMELIVDFLNREAPTPEKPNFRKEYANLIFLLVELQRAGLFSHDDYLMLLMRYNELKDNDPIIPKMDRMLAATRENESTSGEEPAPTPVENPVINFIPTPAEKNNKTTGSFDDGEICRLKEEAPEKIAYIDKPEGVNNHDRLIVQLPIEQVEANRGAANQRAIYVYGISTQREEVSKALHEFATQIVAKWMDNIYRFRRSATKIRKTSDVGQLNQAYEQFKTYTYYDRLCITGHCMDAYLQILKDFVYNSSSSHLLPTTDCLDMLLSMSEASQNIGWVMPYFLELIPLLLSCEKHLDNSSVDWGRGIFSSQQAFSIVGFLSEHYKYFLLCREAIKISNGLYRLIEKCVKANDYPMTCWTRAVAAFLIQARYDLRIRGRGCFAFRARDCRSILPQSGDPKEYFGNFNPDTFLPEEDITNQKRILPFHEIKLFTEQLQTIEQDQSFVINAFIMAGSFKNDFAKLSELANFCGNVSAVRNLESQWLNVIESLCSPFAGKRKVPWYKQLDSLGYTTHYSYATFITLLATRFCFSIHDLFSRFNNECFKQGTHFYEESALAHFLLTMQIITNITTATDEPIELSKNRFLLHEPSLRPSWRSSDLRCLRVLQIRELDATLIPLIFNVFKFIFENLKKNDKLREIFNYAWNCMLTITEQEWIITRMFQACSVERDMEDLFAGSYKSPVPPAVILRRKSDRKHKIEMMEARPSVRSGIIKRLMALSIWNLRATYFDFKIQLREAMPSKSNNRVVQQNQVLADSLVGEMGKSFRDFFLSEDVDKLRLIKAPTIKTFTFTDLNSYWLVSELMEIITIPDNAFRTIKASFLEEVFAIFSTSTLENIGESERVRKLKVSANLLENQPFLNLINTCHQGEDKVRDNLVKMMLDYPADIKLAEDPERLFDKRFDVDRAGILLRMNLIGTMIDFTSSPPDKLCDYALCIFQAMINDVITPERDGEYFSMCYDILLTLVLALFTGSGEPTLDKDGNVKKNRYVHYANFVNRAKTKLGEKILTGRLRCLETLFPISPPISEKPTFDDTFPLGSPMKVGGSGKFQAAYQRQVKHVKLDKNCESVQKRLQRFLYHTHQNDFFHPGTLGNPLPKGMLQQYVVGPPAYPEAAKEVRHPPPPSTQSSFRAGNFPGGPPFYPNQERPQMPHGGMPPMNRPMSNPQPNMPLPSTSMGMQQPPSNFMPNAQGPSHQMLPPQSGMPNNHPNQFNPPMQPPPGYGMPPQPQMNPRMQGPPGEHPMRAAMNPGPIRGMARKRTPSGNGPPLQAAKRPRAEHPSQMMPRPPMQGMPQNPNQPSMPPPNYYMQQQQHQQGPPPPQPDSMWEQSQQPNQGQAGMMHQPSQSNQLPPQQHPQMPSSQQSSMNFNPGNRFGTNPRMPPINHGQPHPSVQRPDDADTKEKLRMTLQNKLGRQALHHQIPPPMNHPQQLQQHEQQQQLRQQQMQQQQQQHQMRPPMNPQQQQQMQMSQQQNFNPQMRM